MHHIIRISCGRQGCSHQSDLQEQVKMPQYDLKHQYGPSNASDSQRATPITAITRWSISSRNSTLHHELLVAAHSTDINIGSIFRQDNKHQGTLHDQYMVLCVHASGTSTESVFGRQGLRYQPDLQCYLRTLTSIGPWASVWTFKFFRFSNSNTDHSHNLGLHQQQE